ncbi:hypothetical protein FOMA001_g12724 [Fusarium oxysporum f. sp. matthiolae]|nr:hypothetical protein FOMA001_g12724 [Fusarium oxysporum f. sp. matthiolae]
MPTFLPTKPDGPFIVEGIKPDQSGKASTGTGGIRLELREFKKNTDLWNLYLVGLWQFQQVSEEDQLSYFQIAGKVSRSHL